MIDQIFLIGFMSGEQPVHCRDIIFYFSVHVFHLLTILKKLKCT